MVLAVDAGVVVLMAAGTPIWLRPGDKVVRLRCGAVGLRSGEISSDQWTRTGPSLVLDCQNVGKAKVSRSYHVFKWRWQ